MKHFAETMALLGTVGKLDKEDELPFTDSLQGKMRRFYNAEEKKIISLKYMRSQTARASRQRRFSSG